jgi:hypothetical protein
MRLFELRLARNLGLARRARQRSPGGLREVNRELKPLTN